MKYGIVCIFTCDAANLYAELASEKEDQSVNPDG